MFLDCYHNKTAVSVREKGIEFHRKFLRSIELKVKLGEKTKTDLAQAQAKLAKARASLAEAMYKYEAAKAEFQRFIGSEPAEKINLASLRYESLLPKNMDAFIQKAVLDNPGVISNTHTKKAARAQFRLQAKANTPSIEAQARWNNQWQYSS